MGVELVALRGSYFEIPQLMREGCASGKWRGAMHNKLRHETSALFHIYMVTHQVVHLVPLTANQKLRLSIRSIY